MAEASNTSSLIDGNPWEQNEENSERALLLKKVLEKQTDLRALVSRIDAAKREHDSLTKENQMLQKYINNSLTSTAVFGATGGAVASVPGLNGKDIPLQGHQGQ
ncbi:hypothetical protein BZG36_01920 [Bifiguratus adelaidae]|uniref:Uncharacterized protein n=1 Tax=Bifiguratus adelaidae TaxID=1938954 RepID=A0A261Y4K9_9FUNG|nr:hypothetical protein BZG36_01920 [Bifiguratus adelaidae]